MNPVSSHGEVRTRCANGPLVQLAPSTRAQPRQREVFFSFCNRCFNGNTSNTHGIRYRTHHFVDVTLFFPFMLTLPPLISFLLLAFLMRCLRLSVRRGSFWDMMCSQGPIAFEYLTRPTPTRLSSAKVMKSTVQYSSMMITAAIISSFTGPDSSVLHHPVYEYAVLMLRSNTTSFYDNSFYNISRNRSELLDCFSCYDAHESIQKKKPR
ncbi:hypothetical protein F5888DRAFT_1202282 [Russula emetica]|nr:hypothetical protein F5888DRAFT_1202282 [Russula emetica]